MSRWLASPLLLALLLCGCDDTAVVLLVHSNYKIPDQLDALCLQVVAANQLEFGRRYPLTENDVGVPRSLSVLPGEQAQDHFDLLLTGEHRGLTVSYQRSRHVFPAGGVEKRHLYVPFCQSSPPPPGGTFQFEPHPLWEQAAVVAVPAAADPMVLLAPSALERFAWKQLGPGGAWGMGHLSGEAAGFPKTATPGKVNRLVAVDVDLDCDLDLLVLTPDGPRLWTHMEDDSFQESFGALPATVTGEFVAAAAGELDNDGYPDLVLVGPTTGVKLLLSDRQAAPGRFRDATDRLTIPSPEKGAVGVAVGLLDGSSMGIALARGTSPDVVIFRKGEGGFEGRELVPPTPKDAASSNAVVIARLNGDELPDLAYARSGGSSVVYLNSIAQPGALGSTAKDIVLLSGTDKGQDILAVDLDNDCRRDLVLAASDGVRIYRNNGDGSFTEQAQASSPPAGTQVTAGDLDGDGLVDLATTQIGIPSVGTYWLRQKSQ